MILIDANATNARGGTVGRIPKNTTVYLPWGRKNEPEEIGIKEATSEYLYFNTMLECIMHMYADMEYTAMYEYTTGEHVCYKIWTMDDHG